MDTSIGILPSQLCGGLRAFSNDFANRGKQLEYSVIPGSNVSISFIKPIFSAHLPNK